MAKRLGKGYIVEKPVEGGGDFSTAEVTIQASAPMPISGIWIVDDDLADTAIFVPSVSDTHTLVLYQGLQTLYFDDAPSSVTGDATAVVVDDINSVLVNGDCIISFEE